MSKKRAHWKPKNAARKRSSNPVALFRREVYRHPNRRAGIAVARRNTAVQDIPTVVRDLFSNQQFRKYLCPLTFPKDMGSSVYSKRLAKVDADKEFIWAASILARFTDELTGFVGLRDKFEFGYLYADWDACAEALDDIERSLGVSNWLIARRFQLLQISTGLTAQKDYLETIISTEALDPLIAVLSIFFSLRCEESVSLENLISELIGFKDLPPDIFDYLLFHICPYYMEEIESPTGVLAIEEPHSVIDRYMSFISMAELTVARDGLESSRMIFRGLEMLEDIKDIRLKNVLFLREKRVADLSVHTSIDKYTTGDYSNVSDRSLNVLEINARASLFVTNKHEPTDSPYEEICEKMGEVLCVTTDYIAAKNRLKKLAMLSFNMPVSTKITSFIEREKENSFDADQSESEIVQAIQGGQNPWNFRAIDQRFGGDNLQQASIQTPESSSLVLQNAVSMDYDQGIAAISTLPIPDYRKHIYQGHIEYRSGRIDDAIECYRAAAKEDNKYVRSRSRQFLFRVIYSEARYLESVQHVVDHYLENPSVSDVYPIERLAKSVLDTGDLSVDVSLAILLSIAARNLGPSWERELSDIFENILFDLGVDRPSDLRPYSSSFKHEELVYFLRYVCVQRILDDTTSFSSVGEIERERIEICRWLMQLDPTNTDTYSSEIKTSVREEEVHKLLDQVNSSKIYVDEDGVLSTADETMRSYYKRFKEVTDSPDLNAQAGKITKLVNDLLRSSGESLSEIRLPASEREGLIGAMLQYFGDQFASNPAYGLDTNVSTSIRHGAFEGYVRRAFAKFGLLCEYDKNNSPIMPDYWIQKLADIEPPERLHILKCIDRFTRKVDGEVRGYLDNYLKIRTGTHDRGLFDFSDTEDGVQELLLRTDTASTYEEFVSNLFSYFWSLTERSLNKIQSKIREEMVPNINRAADTLIASIEKKVSREKVVELVDSVTSAKTEFQYSLSAVADWFCRPSDQIDAPFDFELALDVALKQADLCYQVPKLKVIKEFTPGIIVRGGHFVGSSELFFILLQNVARHSGISGIEIPVNILVSLVPEGVRIECSSPLAEGVDLEATRHLADQAVEKYESDTALRMARREGGSGLSKIWRILEHDYKCKHTVNLIVTDDHRFRTLLSFNSGVILEVASENTSD